MDSIVAKSMKHHVRSWHLFPVQPTTQVQTPGAVQSPPFSHCGVHWVGSLVGVTYTGG